jgi:adenylosuccinate synthase
MARVTVVVGGQYGSEGKGAVCGFLGRTMGERDLAIRVAGPNAGHTVYSTDPNDQTEWKLRCVPVAAVTSRTAQLHIAAGSEIDPIVLFHELSDLDDAGYNATGRLTIHPSATIITQRHLADEQSLGLVSRIGSTGKGIGAARAARIMREANTAKDMKTLHKFLTEDGPLDIADLNHIVIEGTQGYGLGLHTRQYPQVTSSDCRAIDFLGMAGISPWDDQLDQSLFRVIVVARVYPIRVAGNSGPLKGETSWAELGLPDEHTTVTQKVRRVGAWDPELLHEAIAANGGGGWNTQVVLAITMLDQLFPQTEDVTHPEWWEEQAHTWLQEIQDGAETDILLVGTGPRKMTEVAV